MIELNVNLQNKKQTCLHYCFSNELDEDSDDNNEHDVEMSEASDKVEAGAGATTCVGDQIENRLKFKAINGLS